MQPSPPLISLLHATYHAGDAAVDTRRRWLDSATDATRIEHVFSMDGDDLVSVEATAPFLRVVNPGGAGIVTAVRNWNAAAAHATGRLLFVIADDLRPCAAWDELLSEVPGALDPLAFPFAIKVREAHPLQDRRPELLRHPVVSRAYYEHLGLFDPQFRGLYADDDITWTAFSRAVVLDGSRVVLDHAHHALDASLEESESQHTINTDEEQAFGRHVLLEKWGRARRATIPKSFYRPPASASAPRLRARLWRCGASIEAGVRTLARAARTRHD
jgi:hypothetical protein